jgi:membrane protein
MTQPTFWDRAEERARQSELQVGGTNVNVLLVRIGRRTLEVRVMGLAAEMTYYAILSIFPLITALGASLGFLERWIGPAAAQEVERTIIVSLEAVFSPEVTAEVVTPMVQGLLEQERAGFAVGGFLISLFLASRIFRSAIDALDVTYKVEEGRSTVGLWTLGFLFSLGAIVTATVVLSLVVVGPLLGGGRFLAQAMGLGAAFEVLWAIARWPFVFMVATAFLTVLYRVGPNVRNSWRQSFPGAVFGMLALLAVAIGFRLYLSVIGTDTPQITDADEAVIIAAQMVGALMAALLWLWLSGMVILLGGVFNAELSRLRRDFPPRAA